MNAHGEPCIAFLEHKNMFQNAEQIALMYLFMISACASTSSYFQKSIHNLMVRNNTLTLHIAKLSKNQDIHP